MSKPKGLAIVPTAAPRLNSRNQWDGSANGKTEKPSIQTIANLINQKPSPAANSNFASTQQFKTLSAIE